MRLRYTLPGLADLASILDYIADRSPQGAARIHTRIRAVTDLLPRYPLAGAVTEVPTIRRITTTPHPYLIFYEATDAEIIIHAVRHGARDPSDNGRSVSALVEPSARSGKIWPPAAQELYAVSYRHGEAVVAIFIGHGPPLRYKNWTLQ